MDKPPPSPEHWLTSTFSARIAAQGGVVHRKMQDVDRIIGRQAFLDEIDRRGFRALENAGQVIIICNAEPVRFLR